MQRRWLIREAGAMQAGIQPVAGAIAGEDASGAVGAVRCRRQSHEEHAGVTIAETGYRFAPVNLIAKCGTLFASHLFPPRDKTRAPSARDNVLLKRNKAQTRHVRAQ